MQVCGATCNVCSTRIAFQDEGTWCARCKSVVHKECLSNPICPGCNQTRLDPAELFVRSKYCPVCMAPNYDDKDKCRCGAVTQWDTAADYLTRKAEIRNAANKWIWLGAAEIGFGLFLVAITLIVIIFAQRLVYALPFIAIGCAGDGIRRIVNAISYRRFE